MKTMNLCHKTLYAVDEEKRRATAAASAVAATYHNDVKMANDMKRAAPASYVILAFCGSNS